MDSPLMAKKLRLRRQLHVRDEGGTCRRFAIWTMSTTLNSTTESGATMKMRMDGWTEKPGRISRPQSLMSHDQRDDGDYDESSERRGKKRARTVSKFRPAYRAPIKQECDDGERSSKRGRGRPRKDFCE
ncbi:hypothetical protein PMAYCL1PPCAC_26331, partial [Pristionchus mayeri]